MPPQMSSARPNKSHPLYPIVCACTARSLVSFSAATARCFMSAIDNPLPILLPHARALRDIFLSGTRRICHMCHIIMPRPQHALSPIYCERSEISMNSQDLIPSSQMRVSLILIQLLSSAVETQGMVSAIVGLHKGSATTPSPCEIMYASCCGSQYVRLFCDPDLLPSCSPRTTSPNFCPVAAKGGTPLMHKIKVISLRNSPSNQASCSNTNTIMFAKRLCSDNLAA